ncbi:MAG TPA: hypothetical protein VMW34_08460 [Anaerolineales bacterium]|nr:hypothetical protein [Anaerolineales bacterium]
MGLSLTPASLVLVAVITEPRDLEIARIFGWYRIPLRTAPKVIAVDYLAFYQTKAFKEQKWRIQFVAPVRGHELTTRDQLLRDEPNHPRAKDEYYKIQIGPLEQLPEPILAQKWRRITFLYTTGEYLLNARTINDLVVHSEERQVLWKALRDRLTHKEEYKTMSGEDEILDDEVIALLLGIDGIQEQL